MQQYPIQGTVKSAKGERCPALPLPSKEPATELFLDAYGRFKLNVSGQQVTLEFSAIGFETQTVEVGTGASSVLLCRTRPWD